MLFKLVPIKVNKEGEVKLDLLDLRFVVLVLFQMSTFIAILLCRITSGIELSAQGVSNLFVLINGFGVAPCYGLLNGVVAVRLGSSILQKNSRISGTALFIIIFLVCLLTSSTHILLRELYVVNTLTVPLACFLSLYGFLNLLTLFTLFYLCYLHIDDELKEINSKDALTAEDVVDIITMYKRCKNGAELPGLMMFAQAQFLLIVTIFLCVAVSSSILDLSAAISGTLTTVAIVLIIVVRAEDIYAKLEGISVKGRACANSCALRSGQHSGNAKVANLARGLKFHTMLNELNTLGPFTGAGFFNIGKGTFTTMVSTTLTYAIIMMQWKP